MVSAEERQQINTENWKDFITTVTSVRSLGSDVVRGVLINKSLLSGWGRVLSAAVASTWVSDMCHSDVTACDFKLDSRPLSPRSPVPDNNDVNEDHVVD